MSSSPTFTVLWLTFGVLVIGKTPAWGGGLPVDPLHCLSVVPRPGRGTHRQDGVDLPQVIRRQAHLDRAEVVIEVFDPLCARNRHDVLPLRQYPRQGKLARRAALGRCELLDLPDQVEVLLEVFALEAGRVAPVIVGRQVVECFELSRQEPAGYRPRTRSPARARWGESPPQDPGSTGNTRSAGPRWGGPSPPGGSSPATPRTDRGNAPSRPAPVPPSPRPSPRSASGDRRG